MNPIIEKIYTFEEFYTFINGIDSELAKKVNIVAKQKLEKNGNYTYFFTLNEIEDKESPLHFQVLEESKLIKVFIDTTKLGKKNLTSVIIEKQRKILRTESFELKEIKFPMDKFKTTSSQITLNDEPIDFTFMEEKLSHENREKQLKNLETKEKIREKIEKAKKMITEIRNESDTIKFSSIKKLNKEIENFQNEIIKIQRKIEKTFSCNYSGLSWTFDFKEKSIILGYNPQSFFAVGTKIYSAENYFQLNRKVFNKNEYFLFDDQAYKYEEYFLDKNVLRNKKEYFLASDGHGYSKKDYYEKEGIAYSKKEYIFSNSTIYSRRDYYEIELPSYHGVMKKLPGDKRDPSVLDEDKGQSVLGYDSVKYFKLDGFLYPKESYFEFDHKAYRKELYFESEGRIYLKLKFIQHEGKAYDRTQYVEIDGKVKHLNELNENEYFEIRGILFSSKISQKIAIRQFTPDAAPETAKTMGHIAVRRNSLNQ